MKLTPAYLKEMVKNELKECGMMPPPPPPPQAPPPCEMTVSGGPPEGSAEATFADEVANLVADIVYNVLMAKVDKEDAAQDHSSACSIAHPGESHEFWEIMKVFKKAGLDPVLNETSK